MRDESFEGEKKERASDNPLIVRGELARQTLSFISTDFLSQDSYHVSAFATFKLIPDSIKRQRALIEELGDGVHIPLDECATAEEAEKYIKTLSQLFDISSALASSQGVNAKTVKWHRLLCLNSGDSFDKNEIQAIYNRLYNSKYPNNVQKENPPYNPAYSESGWLGYTPPSAPPEYK